MTMVVKTVGMMIVAVGWVLAIILWLIFALNVTGHFWWL